MPGRYAGLIRGTVTASLMLIAMGGTGAAGPYEDAVIAYRRGDYTTAMQLFRPLADDGREGAQYYLGFMYYNGKGVAQDYTEAAKWFRLAAEQGRADAQYSFGHMYLNGQSVSQDFVVAYMWFDLAASQGMRVAIKVRNELGQRMTPTQIAEAQKLARDWKPKSHRETVDIRQFPWSSIGKISSMALTSGQFCTGAVIGPNQFLTAAHCLFNQRTGRFMPAGSIHILLGYEKGEYRVHRVATRYSIPPAFDASLYTYRPDRNKSLAAARHDWAIIYTDEVFPPDVRPLRLASAAPSLGTAIKVVGYPIERQHMLTTDPHCRSQVGPLIKSCLFMIA